MKKKIGNLLLYAFLSMLFTNCNPQNEEYHYTENFELRQLVQETETVKTTKGRFILFFATYYSSESKTDYVKMFAKVDGNYRLVEVPLHIIRLNINDSITTPIMQVRYIGYGKRTNDDVFDRSWYGEVYIITCPQKYLPEKLLPIEL